MSEINPNFCVTKEGGVYMEKCNLSDSVKLGNITCGDYRKNVGNFSARLATGKNVRDQLNSPDQFNPNFDFCGTTVLTEGRGEPGYNPLITPYNHPVHNCPIESDPSESGIYSYATWAFYPNTQYYDVVPTLGDYKMDPCTATPGTGVLNLYEGYNVYLTRHMSKFPFVDAPGDPYRPYYTLRVDTPHQLQIAITLIINPRYTDTGTEKIWYKINQGVLVHYEKNIGAGEYPVQLAYSWVISGTTVEFVFDVDDRFFSFLIDMVFPID